MPTQPLNPPGPEPSRAPVWITFAIGVVLAIAFTIWKLKPREPEEPAIPSQTQAATPQETKR
jgi:hypothetical protein